jgi:hypothetical protein
VEDYYKNLSGDLPPYVNFEEIERSPEDETAVILPEQTRRVEEAKQPPMDQNQRSGDRGMSNIRAQGSAEKKLLLVENRGVKFESVVAEDVPEQTRRVDVAKQPPVDRNQRSGDREMPNIGAQRSAEKKQLLVENHQVKFESMVAEDIPKQTRRVKQPKRPPVDRNQRSGDRGMPNIGAQRSAEKKQLLVENHRVKFESVVAEDAPNFGRAAQERTSGGDHGINKTQLSNMRRRRASGIDRGAALKASKKYAEKKRHTTEIQKEAKGKGSNVGVDNNEECTTNTTA